MELFNLQEKNGRVRKKYRSTWEKGREINQRLPKGLSSFNCGIITGFTMGEGCFCIVIKNSITNKTKLQVEPKFTIGLKLTDKKILYEIKNMLGVGKVYERKNIVTYQVKKLSDLLEVIIPFFDRYSLTNIKYIDFQYFKIICYKLMAGEGKEIRGVKKILSIREVMNESGRGIRKKYFN